MEVLFPSTAISGAAKGPRLLADGIVRAEAACSTEGPAPLLTWGQVWRVISAADLPAGRAKPCTVCALQLKCPCPSCFQALLLRAFSNQPAARYCPLQSAYHVMGIFIRIRMPKRGPPYIPQLEYKPSPKKEIIFYPDFQPQRNTTGLAASFSQPFAHSSPPISTNPFLQWDTLSSIPTRKHPFLYVAHPDSHSRHCNSWLHSSLKMCQLSQDLSINVYINLLMNLQYNCEFAHILACNIEMICSWREGAKTSVLFHACFSFTCCNSYAL